MGFFGFGKKNKEKDQEKMNTGLEKPRTGFWGNILNTLTGSVIDDEMYDDLEEQLILADVGGEVAVRLVDKLRDDGTGLIVYAGNSFVQLPITTDYVSAKRFLSSIDTGAVPVQGTAIGDAILTAAKSFSAQREKSRVIILITDGENHEDDAVAAARDAASMGIKVYTIGVGSTGGQPIPFEGGLLKDRNGDIVVTRLDEATLREIAREGGGAYVHATGEEFGLNPIIDDIRRLEAEELSSQVFEAYDEQYMYFFAAALVLLVIEMLIGRRKARRQVF